MSATDESGDFVTGEAFVQLTVQVPPSRVYLRVDGNEVMGENIGTTLTDQGNAELGVDCVAEAARPKPTFKWFIGDNEIQGTINDSVEKKQENGKADYVETLTYYADAKHNGKALRCEIIHAGYTEAQKERMENKIEKNLELFCKLKLNLAQFRRK